MRGFSRKSHKSRRIRAWMAYPLIAVIWLIMGNIHQAHRPNNLSDICLIFEDRRDWYHAARDSESRWGTPAHIQMSIIQQESSFRFDARPPRRKLMGVIPWKRQSNAYGFAQALDGTWSRYKKDTGRLDADRDDFGDAIDFVGWYTNLSNQSVGISKWDPYNQYLAYHEGQTGWKKGSYKGKTWLQSKAGEVDSRAKKWSQQLQSCRESLDNRWWFFSFG